MEFRGTPLRNLMIVANAEAQGVVPPGKYQAAHLLLQETARNYAQGAAYALSWVDDGAPAADEFATMLLVATAVDRGNEAHRRLGEVVNDPASFA